MTNTSTVTPARGREPEPQCVTSSHHTGATRRVGVEEERDRSDRSRPDDSRTRPDSQPPPGDVTVEIVGDRLIRSPHYDSWPQWANVILDGEQERGSGDQQVSAGERPWSLTDEHPLKSSATLSSVVGRPKSAQLQTESDSTQERDARTTSTVINDRHDRPTNSTQRTTPKHVHARLP